MAPRHTVAEPARELSGPRPENRSARPEGMSTERMGTPLWFMPKMQDLDEALRHRGDAAAQQGVHDEGDVLEHRQVQGRSDEC